MSLAVSPINEASRCDGDAFLAHQRNVVLVGGTSTGESPSGDKHSRACIRDGAAAGSSMSSIW